MRNKVVKNIWLVNKYAMPPQYESRLRTNKFAHYLHENGYNVTIFGSSIMHNMNIDLIEGNQKYIKKTYDDLHYIHIKSCRYNKTAGFKRVLSELQFHYRLVRIAKELEAPDLVIGTTFPIISNPVLDYCKKNNILYITETLDWWPDDFVEFGFLSKRNPIMKYLFWRAKENYIKSDALIFSPEGCFQYLKDKKWDKDNGGQIDLQKVYYINNGVDLNDFDTYKKIYKIDDPDLKCDKKKIIYLGSLRLANNVLSVIKAAEQLKDRKDVQFIIYGNGEERETLIDYCNSHNLTNVTFKDKWIDPKYVPFVLNQSYINIMNYISSDIVRYGISSSKMFQYMASGRPIVCNLNINYCPITKNRIGVSREMRNSQDYADAIKSILNLPISEYEDMCKRSRVASKEYDYQYLTKKLIDVIKSL